MAEKYDLERLNALDIAEVLEAMGQNHQDQKNAIKIVLDFQYE